MRRALLAVGVALAWGCPGVLFTNEAKKGPCAWADKAFADLDEADRARFLDTELIVVQVTDASKEAVRDLFIRQQGGTPLKPQEIRDAWPGGMTEVILQIGGKKRLDRCPGHDFFREFARDPGQPEGRQMAAQMLSLLVTRRDTRQHRGIARRRIDQFYYDHLSITDDDPHVKRFRKILMRGTPRGGHVGRPGGAVVKVRAMRTRPEPSLYGESAAGGRKVEKTLAAVEDAFTVERRRRPRPRVSSQRTRPR